MENQSNLQELKENYKEIQEKYNLPAFERLNEDFHIEKIAENETELLIREVRKFMADRLFNYLRFIESFLNPVNVPMFVFSVIKIITPKEKEKLTEIYKKLAKMEVDLIELDIQFSEQKEAQFIKESYKIWQDIKEDMLKIVEVIKNNWDNKNETNSKGYFG